MSLPRLLFLHGMDSAPGGFKPQFLQSKGFQVLNPALPKESLRRSIEIAQAELDQHKPPIVVGSSRGGAVAMSLDLGGAGLVLIAPAWRWFEVPPKVPSNTIILHSEQDEVIPIADSRELVEINRLAADQLVIIGRDHSMNDIPALEAMVAAIAINS